MEGERRIDGWRVGSLTLFLIGVVLCALSLIDVTPGFGVVQMVQLLLGLTALTFAGFIHMYSLRPSDTPRSLQADIGIRLAATGLVFAYVSGLSDTIGIGTHVTLNGFERPAVGWLQLIGIVLGIFSIAAGMILYHTSRGARETSMLGFIVPAGQNQDGTDAEAEAQR